MNDFSKWTLQPEDIDDEDKSPSVDDTEQDETEDVEDEGEDSTDEEDEESGDSPDFAKDLATQRQMIDDLRRSVGRAQSLADQWRQGHDEVREELRAQQESVANILAAIVDGIDDTAIDPALKQKVRTAQQEIAEAARTARTKAELMEELGINPRQREVVQQQLEAQAVANALTADLEDEMSVFGVDPDEFDWEGVKAQLLSGGVEAAKRFARTKIREAVMEQQAAQRRTARKTAAGPTPKGAAGVPPKNDLSEGDFAARKKALDALLA